jgi:16S rRNA (guanine1207-N2)-methyltransferase
LSKKGLDSGSRLLIENLKIEGGGLIADVGTGTGVIGIAAARLHPEVHVHLLDVNLRIVNLARENVELNRLKNAEVFLSDNFSAVDERTYNQILSNPAQHLGNEFLEELAADCLKHLKSGGSTTWVVQKHVKPYIERLFKSVFGNCEVVAHGGGHVLMKARK